MKTTRADIEFYREMMEHFQAGSASKSALVRTLQDEMTALRDENRAMRESHREDMGRLRKSHREDMDKLRKSYEETIAAMQVSFERRLDRMAEANAGLSRQLGDAIAAGKVARGRKYGRTAEQRNLLNTQKRIRLILRDMGAHIPRATLNRFFMDGAQALLTMLGGAFRSEIRRGGYFMVDETLQTVGVDDEELGRRYMNRYMWEFYNREKGLVEYVYTDFFPTITRQSVKNIPFLIFFHRA